MKSNTNISDLQNNTIINILIYLDIEDVRNFLITNEQFNKLKDNNILWYMKLKYDYPCCLNIKNYSYKYIYLTMEYKGMVYDWSEIMKTEHTNKIPRIVKNVKEKVYRIYHDKLYSNEFTDIMLEIQPETFIRDFHRGECLTNVMKKLLDDDQDITIKCFYNDKYRLDFYKNSTDDEFICLYEIFDINKYWIARNKNSNTYLTSYDFTSRVTFGPSFNIMFNNSRETYPTGISDVHYNTEIIFRFFLLISNIYILNVDDIDDDDDGDDDLASLISEFSYYRRSTKLL